MIYSDVAGEGRSTNVFWLFVLLLSQSLRPFCISSGHNLVTAANHPMIFLTKGAGKRLKITSNPMFNANVSVYDIRGA